MNQTKLGLMFIAALMTGTAYAQDLTGIWQQIDDKTGSPKAIIEIRQNDNGTFAGKIIKVTPRPGYTNSHYSKKLPNWQLFSVYQLYSMQISVDY
ncbi:DUF2147 domain-containing protein, partial [Klebsiella pneumoniae]|uniref:DUF2147 domain-containing protein n=1 Tax=Klebsiella pneumoniae TaxID=573 RepID=UPI001C4E2CD3